MAAVKLYDVKGVAELLGVSSSTVWRLIRRRELPIVRINSRGVRVSQRALERYIDRREVFDGGGKPLYYFGERNGSRWRSRGVAQHGA